MSTTNPYSSPDDSAAEVPVEVVAQGKPPLLSWWVAIPLALFLVVQSLHAWPRSQAYSSEPSAAWGHFVGLVLAGPLLATLFAWLAYRIFSRSTVAGSITFVALLVLAAAGSFTSSLPTRAQVLTFDEFQFEKPAGWKRIKDPGAAVAVGLVLDRQDRGQIDAAIKVEVIPPGHLTALDVCQVLAGNDGRILETPVALGSATGTRVEAPSDVLARPCVAVVVERDGRLYVVSASRASDVDVTEPFDRVIDSWQWTR